MGDELARLVHDRFSRCQFKIPSSQWTVLAGIAIKNDLEGSFEVVSIGAGLKCLPLDSYKDNGLNEMLVHDCHGEILARRAFLAFILDQIKSNSDDSCMARIGDKWKLKEGLSLHMYVSHAPCGDASMSTLLAESQKDPKAILHTESKRIKYSDGALLRRGRDDFSATVGTLRTKPGRADAPFAACMSCSDKIAAWTVLGIQGSLLMHLLDTPLWLESITVGDEFDREALQRALNTRVVFSPHAHPLGIISTKTSFCLAKSDDREPSPEAQVWFKGCSMPGTIVKGKKKGSGNPKNNNLPKSSQSFVSKARLFEQFAAITEDQFESYSRAKELSSTYQLTKEEFLNHPTMEGWMRGPR